MRTPLSLVTMFLILTANPVNAVEFSQRLEGLIEDSALYRADGVPIEVRDIPSHPDDQIGPVGPIEDDFVNFRSWTIGVRYLAGVRWRWLEFQAGPVISGTTNDYSGPPLDGNQREYLYSTYRTGDNFDGGCDCLRYFELKQRTPTLGGRLILSVWTPYLPMFDSEGFRLRASLEIDPFGRPLEFETGWDRYNRDQVRAVIEAGRLREFVSNLRLEFDGGEPGRPSTYVFVDGGLVLSKFSPRHGFNQLSLINRDHFRFALGLGITN